MIDKTNPPANPEPSQGEKLKPRSLSNEFDALLARMQEPGAREAMQAAFDSSPQELGQAAVVAVRKRVVASGEQH